jgi:D-amino peptidase
MNAALAAWFGVPVVAVSGDDAAVDEVKSVAPGVRGAVVKRAINTRAVELRPLADARSDIQAAARDGVRTARKPAREQLPSYQVRMQFQEFTIPEVASAFSEVTLVAPDTVQFSRETMPDAYRLIRVLYRFINTD